MPQAKERGCCRRPTSKRSGSVKRSGSRLAAPSSVRTVSPLADRRAVGEGRVDQRHAPVDLHRRVEAQDLLDADGSSERSARSRSSSAGWAHRAMTPLPMRLVVVSKPAANSRITLAISSSWVSRSPSVLGGDQRREQVVLGMRAANLDEVVEVGPHLTEGDGSLAEHLGVGVELERRCPVAAPAGGTSRGPRRARRRAHRSPRRAAGSRGRRAGRPRRRRRAGRAPRRPSPRCVDGAPRCAGGERPADEPRMRVWSGGLRNSIGRLRRSNSACRAWSSSSRNALGARSNARPCRTRGTPSTDLQSA